MALFVIPYLRKRKLRALCVQKRRASSKNNKISVILRLENGLCV